MNIVAKTIFTGVFALALSVLGGCDGFGSGPTISISYDRPAEYAIPEKVKNLAIQEFSGVSPEDQRWAQAASDKTSSKLDACNRRYERYRLVDHNKLKTILAEKDLQLAFGSPEEARKHAGKLSSVDAIIYGSVKVSSQQMTYTDTTYDFVAKRPVQVQKEKFLCTAIVSFNMVDVGTGSSYVTWTSPQQTFDSQKDGQKSFWDRMQGSQTPIETCIDTLVDNCVDQFVAKISPTQVIITEKLSKSKSPAVTTGNNFAAAGAIDEALKNYLQASTEDPADQAAIFNAGVMYESKGDMGKASEYYTRAISLKDDKKYIRAHARVAAASKGQ